MLDSSVEGVLWVQIGCKLSSEKLNVCVVYLPPHGSSRYVDAAAFFEELHAQMFTYQQSGPYTIMGDFNSWIGGRLDFIDFIGWTASWSEM